MRHLFYFLLLCCVVACSKNPVVKNPHPQVPVSKPAGTPVGAKISKQIGAAGGSIQSADGSIKVIVPAGAVATNTEFSIQEVTNTCAAGVGKSYALLPHGVNFSKPVSLEFTYEETDQISAPAALAPAYQDAGGVWRMITNATHNVGAKKIVMQTTHFSNWVLMQWLQLKPVSAIVAPGASLELQVLSYVTLNEDGLAPLVPPDGFEVGVGEGELLASHFIKKWSVVGPGSVEGAGAKGTYRAPAQQAGVANAVVTASLNDPQATLMLLSQITIMGEGIMYRIGGGEWQELPGHAVKGNSNFNLAGVEGDRFMAIEWPGGAGNFSWLHNPDTEKGEKAIAFIYRDENGTQYKSNYFEDDIYYDSGGSFVVDNWGDVGTYITGSFSISRSAYFVGTDDQDEAGRTTVEGVFRVRRIR